MSNDLQANLGYISMVDYDSFLLCHLTEILFIFHTLTKELKLIFVRSRILLYFWFS